MTDAHGRLAILRADSHSQWDKLGKPTATLIWLDDSFYFDTELRKLHARLASNNLSDGVLNYRRSPDHTTSSGRVYLDLAGGFQADKFGNVRRHRATDLLRGLLRKCGEFFQDSPDVRFDTLDPLLGKTWFAAPFEPPQRAEDYRDPPSKVDHALIWLLNPMFQEITKDILSRIEIPDAFGLLIRSLDGLIVQLQPDSTTTEIVCGPGYRSVRWGSKTFEFTPTEAACVEVMYKALMARTPAIHFREILDLAGTSADKETGRLRDVFRKGNHPAWGAMIVKVGARGLYRIALPHEESKNPR